MYALFFLKFVQGYFYKSPVSFLKTIGNFKFLVRDPENFLLILIIGIYYPFFAFFLHRKKNPLATNEILLAASGILPFAASGFPLAASGIPFVASGIFYLLKRLQMT